MPPLRRVAEKVGVLEFMFEMLGELIVWLFTPLSEKRKNRVKVKVERGRRRAERDRYWN